MRALVLLAVLGAAACSTPAAPPLGSLDGNWSGTVGIVEYEALLAQRGTELDGSGAIGPTPGSGAEFATRLTAVTGTVQRLDVRLTYGSETGAIATFAGVVVSASAIRGTIQVGSAPAAPLTLYRR
jgi:hypothetical protein